MGLMKKLTSALVASSLVLSLAGSAFAAYTPNAGTEAGMRMMELKILKGRPGDDKLAVNAELTRAELVTIIVRAFGKEADAQLLKGAPAFPDTAAHWASGEIAMAKALVEKAGADAIGMPDGTFAPDAKLTPAQAVAFLMKFMGIQRDTTKSWPADYLDAAVAAGLITAEDKATIAPMVNENATRGLAFYLFDNAFYSYELPNGKTFYTTYADTEAPALTATAEATTMDSKVTVTGTVGTDAVAVYVGSTKVTVDANGAFSADVALAEVKEYDILVTAADVAGNVAEKTLKVARIIGTASAIEATDITVAAGATVDVAAAVKDAKGNTVAGATIAGESTVGTFEAGKFTAATTAGTGTLTLKSGEITKTVNVTVTAGALAAVAPAKASVAKGELVKFEAKDAHGNVVTGATFSQTSADAMLDSATGNFMASKAATYTVSATKDGVTVQGTVGVYNTTASKLVVSAPAAMVGNDESSYEVTVSAVDSNGNLVASYDKNITISGEFTAAPNTVLTKKASAGVATFKIVADDANRNTEIDVNAVSNNGTADIKGTASVNVVAQVPTALKLDAPKFLTVNDGNVQGTVYVVDQMGEVMVGSNSWTVGLNVTGPAYLTADNKTSTTVVATGDDAALNFTLYPVDATSVGNVTITATFTGFETATATTTAAYGLAASKISVENVSTEAVKAADLGVFKFKVGLTDKNGVPRVAGTGGETVTLKFNTNDYDELNVLANTDAAALTAGTVDDAGNALSAKTVDITIPEGESFTYVGVTAYKFVGNVEFEATGTDLTKAAGTVSFKAGDAYEVVFTREDAIDVLTSAPEATLTAQLLDAAGNNVPKADVKVKFSAASYAHVKLNGAAEAYKVVTDANGQATVKVTVMPYNSTYSINVEHDIDANDVYADTVSLTLNMKAAISNSISLQTWAADDSGRKSAFEAGEQFNIRAYVKDNNGLVVTSTDVEDTLVLEGLKLSNSDVVEAAVTWTFIDAATGDDYYQATLTARKAGSFTFTVSETSVAAEVKASRTVNVTPGAYDKLVIEQVNAAGGLDITKGAVKAFTVRVADQFGNLVSPTQVAHGITFDVGFGDTDDVTNAGIYYDVRTSETSVSKLTGWSIGAGTNSKTIYLVTNDADTAKLVLTVTNTVDLPGGFDATTTYSNVTVAQ